MANSAHAAPTLRLWAAGALLAACAAALHFHALADVPMHVQSDEVHFAVHANALATTGRDLNGRRFPVFFAIRDPIDENDSNNVWFQPMLFYAVAGALKVAPLGEKTIRAVPALIGILDVVLLYILGWRLFRDLGLAIITALFLIVTPVHVIFSRVTADYICSVPFVIGWLLCVVGWMQTGRTRHLFVGGLLLGIGFFSYIAAWIMMPFYLLLTIALVRPTSRAGLLNAAVACAGFAVPMLVVAAWLLEHPAMLADTFKRYQFGRGSPGASTGYLLYNTFAERLSVYWDYFNPSYLLLSGGSNPIDSTRRAGVLLFFVAVFLVAGVLALWQRRREPVKRLMLTGFFSAPLAAIAINERFCSDRELFLLPFAALVATSGVQSLWSRGRLARMAVVVTALAIATQFGMFYRDYIGDYPLRTYGLFDPFEFQQITQQVVATDARDRVPGLLLSRNMIYAPYRLKFYLLVAGRDDLFARTQYADAAALASAAPGTLLIVPGTDDLSTLVATGRFVVHTRITDLVGRTAAVILRASS